MSENGNRGNGFDFLIDPYHFGGIPRSATTVPYPALALDEFDGRVEGAFDIELVQILEEWTSSSQALSGTIRDTLIRVYLGPDSLDSITASALSGTLAQILRSFNADTESYDSTGSVALEGALRRILIRVYVDEGALDGFDGAGSVALGGTLS